MCGVTAGKIQNYSHYTTYLTYSAIASNIIRISIAQTVSG